jgi:hypothetical protein
MKEKLNIKSTTLVEKPQFNDWMNMFKVSSQYKESVPIPKGYFDIRRFKNRIKNNEILK